MRTPTQKQLREQIEQIDAFLSQLVPWEATLTEARRRYLRAGDAQTVRLIDDGMNPSEGRPADSALEPFDRRWPGLVNTRQRIAEARERRALLDEQRVSAGAVAIADADARARANAISDRATALAQQSSILHRAVSDVAALALNIALETRGIWEDNIALDKMCEASDIPRPETPQLAAPELRKAVPLAALLYDHFCGGTPNAVSGDLIRAIRGQADAVPDVHDAQVQ